ncbi:HupE/UreJ family protein [Methylotenera sp. N17]|uniref:HupE/UreJ family protein n=1 Tax=Methylotenera sp. N17 TaxID=1502761 RepID=UPI0006914198|nr:HupE/UreJ family protein [Methylotenera sp. N17]
MMKKQFTLSIVLSLFSGFALAHPGHGLTHGFTAGLLHPLLGWDHLLMMLAVGVWAANVGGKARWQLPLTFVCTMLLGALLGMAGIAIGGVESTIAAGLIALGVVLMTRFAIHRELQLLFTALFALMHGLAHGTELYQDKMANMALPLLGMLIATAGLHGLGYVLGMQRHRLLTLSQSLLAGLMLGLGANLLLTV